MKVLMYIAIIGLIAVIGATADDRGAVQDSCYKNVSIACDSNAVKKKALETSLESCSAKYGAINTVIRYLQKYANNHIVRSFEYLLLSTHFSNYQANRPGFEKLYRKLSDEKWHDAIDLIKHITKRGGIMDFNKKDTKVDSDNITTYELYEIQSLAKALDMEKSLANEAFSIHKEATRRKDEFHDPEVSYYLEREFMTEHSENIRKLSGYTSDLRQMLNTEASNDGALAVYLFDEYLQKQ